MTTVLADNVFNIAVKGNFDDCQSMVKKMFAAENSGDKFLKGKNNPKLVPKPLPVQKRCFQH